MIPAKIFKNKITIIILIFTAVAVAIAIWVTTALGRNEFYEGIYIEGINLNKMNTVQAEEAVKSKLAQEYPGKNLVLVYGDRTWKIPLADIGFKFLIDDAVKQASDIFKSGGIFKRLSAIYGINNEETHINVGYNFDLPGLNKKLANIKNEIDCKSHNAKISYKDGKFNFIEDASGREAITDKNLKIITDSLDKRKFTGIELHVEEIIPDIRISDVKDITYELSSFSTSFNQTDTNRTHNIKLACEKLNNWLLMPGEEFSMDQALGPRTVDNGYMEAPVIFKNDLVKGIGGGICQVTTTLYNAVLKAFLKVLERANHSMPLGYVGAGLDATIAEGYLDFKFANNTDYAILLNAEVTDNVMRIRMLGRRPKESITVKLVSEIVAELQPEGEEIVTDKSLAPGVKIREREARSGLNAVVYRETYNKNGDMVNREKISDDIYPPVKAQYRVGA